MTFALSPSVAHSKQRFRNAAELQRALWGIPLERIIIDPFPGIANEAC
jgi:hypothetical protein